MVIMGITFNILKLWHSNLNLVQLNFNNIQKLCSFIDLSPPLSTITTKNRSLNNVCPEKQTNNSFKCYQCPKLCRKQNVELQTEVTIILVSRRTELKGSCVQFQTTPQSYSNQNHIVPAQKQTQINRKERRAQGINPCTYGH